MLGKGLESLIPPHSNNSQGGNTPPNSLPHTEPHQPAITPESELPAPHEPVFPVHQSVPENPVFVGSTPFDLAQGKPLITDAPSAPSSPLPYGKPMSRSQKFPDAIFQIEVEKIRPNPHQPRRDFNEENLRDLADSIREFGILQPLVVTKVEKVVPTGTEVEYELIAGERRLMAAKMAGLPRVPVVIRTIDADRERLELAVIENLQRQNLNPIETARAFARLQDEFRLTQRDIATQLGKSREVVANTLRLLDLPSHIQESLAKGEISESHGRLLLGLDDKVVREKLFRDLLETPMTTRELKGRVESAKRPKHGLGLAASGAAATLGPEMLSLQEKLSSELGAPVKIEAHGDSGKITITFYSEEELKSIVGRLGGEEA